MNKLLFIIVAAVLLFFWVANDAWHMTLSTADYEITVSFVLFVVFVVLIWYVLSLLLKPLGWWKRFKDWRKGQKQEDKNIFFVQLMTTLLDHNTQYTQELIHKATKLYGKNSQETLLVSALLRPQQDTFIQLNQNSKTKLAGLYGLVEEAEKSGNYEEISTLLQQVPDDQQKTPWVQQTKMRLALNQSDWSEALRLLEQNKKYLPKQIFLSHKACLLLKLGHVKQAYHLAPSHVAVALAYAKIAPKKAQRILSRTWCKSPCWPVYVAYKNSLPENKRLKAILALTRDTRDERYSLLARADMDIESQNWARAKENLENYLNKYPLTHQVADMMAFIERTGWHHEEAALQWENKAIEAEDDSLWLCSKCNHLVAEWQILCPHCNAFDSLYNK